MSAKSNEQLKQEAVTAIRVYYKDDSVSVDKILEGLDEIKTEVDSTIKRISIHVFFEGRNPEDCI